MKFPSSLLIDPFCLEILSFYALSYSPQFPFMKLMVLVAYVVVAKYSTIP